MKHLPPPLRTLVCKLMNLRRVPAGSRVCEAGDPASELFMLLSGSVRLPCIREYSHRSALGFLRNARVVCALAGVCVRLRGGDAESQCR